MRLCLICSFLIKVLALTFHRNSERGWIEIKGGYLIFDLPEAISPEKWNSVCFSINGIVGSFEIWFNSKIIKNGTFEFLRGNMKLNETVILGSLKDSIFYGQITDLNIWSNFNDESIEEYHECKTPTMSEDVLKWNEISWKNESIILREDRNMCMSNRNIHYYKFKTGRTYDEGFRLCDQLGGKAYLPENGTLNAKRLIDSCPWFWIPIRYGQNNWVSDIDKKIILDSEINWNVGSPLDKTTRSCLYLDNPVGTVGNTACDATCCNICELKTPLNFKLDGLCENSIIDDEYFLQYDSGTKDINWRGFGGSMMRMNITSRQWEIVDQLNHGVILGRTILESPEPENYPLGLNMWDILNDTCVGPNQKIVLNLKFSHCNKVIMIL